MKKQFSCLFLVLAIMVVGCSGSDDKLNSEKMQDMEGMDSESMDGMMGENEKFRQMCKDDGYEWMVMKPTQDGKIIREAEECWGCMVEGVEHVCDMDRYEQMTAEE